LFCDVNTNKAENELNNYVNVYPNPVSNKIYIENNSSKEICYLVYNSYGEKVKLGSSRDNYIEIDLSSSPTGVYYLHYNGNNFSISKKIVLIK